MVKSSIDGSPVAPFLMKCYEMVDDESTNDIISWANSNDSFVIWDITHFTVQLLPKYFKHSNLSSFIRQLNIYGFRKIDTGRWEYSNEGFLRGQKQLLKNITRRSTKNPQSRNTRKFSLQMSNSNVACHEAVNFGIEGPKSNEGALIQELIKLRHVQESSENKLLALTETIQVMQKDHQKMMSLLMKSMRSTEFLVQLMHSKESIVGVGKNVQEQVSEGNEVVAASDRMLIDYHLSVDAAPRPLLDSERFTDSDPFDVIKDFHIDDDFMKMLMEENLSLENHSSLTEEINLN